MRNLDEILRLPPQQINRCWNELDQIVSQLTSSEDQLKAWNDVVVRLTGTFISRGHPYFRMGVLHLWIDTPEDEGIRYLELAFDEDKKHAAAEGKIPQRLAAYRLLCLTKGFLAHLRKSGSWQAKHLEGDARSVLLRTLLTVYDYSRQHVLDMPAHTFQSFFSLIQSQRLSAFAIENYMTAENIFELLITAGSGIVPLGIGEYALARATIGLLGGVLEAILCDKLPPIDRPTLGALINLAVKEKIIRVGTRLSVLSSMVLYFRNYVHANRQADQSEYIIDMNVAKGTKVMLDWAISEMLTANSKARTATG